MNVDFLWRKMWMKEPTGAAQLMPAVTYASAIAHDGGIAADSAVVTITHRLNIYY
jgi:hypothetical protein